MAVWCHSVRRRLGVQMRCRECAAEAAVTDRLCSGCGAPIVGQPPVVADTVVADAVVAAVRGAAGEAVPAGVARQAWPEPYVPGSGNRLPGELRLVLAGYVGLAAGLFAAALASVAATVLAVLVDLNDPDYAADDVTVAGFGLMVGFFAARGCALGAEAAQGAYPVFDAASAAHRSTYGHGGGLEAWWAHADP